MSASTVPVEPLPPPPKPEVSAEEEGSKATTRASLAKRRHSYPGCASRTRCPDYCYPELEFLGRRARRAGHRRCLRSGRSHPTKYEGSRHRSKCRCLGLSGGAQRRPSDPT